MVLVIVFTGQRGFILLCGWTSQSCTFGNRSVLHTSYLSSHCRCCNSAVSAKQINKSSAHKLQYKTQVAISKQICLCVIMLLSKTIFACMSSNFIPVQNLELTLLSLGNNKKKNNKKDKPHLNLCGRESHAPWALMST